MSAHSDTPSLSRENTELRDDSLWQKLPAIGLVLTVGGLGGAVATGRDDLGHFWHAYLTAFMFALALGLGGLFFVIILHLTRAGWGVALRRLAEHLAFSVPFVALFGLAVVFFGAHDLFEWTHPGVVEGDEILSKKAGYLNETGMRIRYFVYLAVWSVLVFTFWKWSRDQDRASDPSQLTHRMRAFSAPALALFALSLTFAAFDMLMALDPHWFSTIFGVYYFTGAALTVHAVLCLVAYSLLRGGHLSGVVTREHFHDLGKYMFGFTIFWTYIAFSQYFLIWYADIPEETFWFSYRGHGEWLYLSLALVVLRFLLPWFLLLRRPIKRMPGLLCWAAALIVFTEFLDIYWLVQPAHAHHAAAAAHAADNHHLAHWYETVIPFNEVDMLALVGFLGVVAMMFGISMKGRPLVPINDPRLAESVHFQNF
ncbi:MAG: hypothetical protein V3V08_19380 [Nannocystaceae bacterium]